MSRDGDGKLTIADAVDSIAARLWLCPADKVLLRELLRHELLKRLASQQAEMLCAQCAWENGREVER